MHAAKRSRVKGFSRGIVGYLDKYLFRTSPMVPSFFISFTLRTGKFEIISKNLIVLF